MNWLKKLFQKKPVEFPKNSSWMLNDDLSPNIKNLKRCKEFIILKDIKQSKRWHKEGNAWNHTILVAKEMYKIINNQLANIPLNDKKVLMIAALCHDLGKATTTYFDDNDKEWHCKNHGLAGERITRNLIFDEKDYWMREEICWLVRWHMQFHHFLNKGHKERFEELTRLAQGNSTIEKLLWLNFADSLGSKSKENSIESVEERFNEIKDLAVANRCFSRPYKQFTNKSNFNMYIMIGVPGSGKDTYIQKFLPNLESISRDDIREEMTHGNIQGRKIQLDTTKESIVTDIVNSRIKACCEKGTSFIINQTNMKKRYRTELKETAFKYGTPNIIYVYVEAPSIELCKERRGHGKWDSIIDRMWGDFEFPDRSECNEFVFYKQK